MRRRSIALCLAVAASSIAFGSGCPEREQKQVSPQAVERYGAYAEGIFDEESLLPELKRLARLHSEPGSLEGLSGGDGESRYEITSAVDAGHVSLSLLDASGSGDYTLHFAPPGGAGMPETIRAEATNGGYQLEINCNPQLSMKLSARWLQGRYLQISREYLLSAEGSAQELEEGARSWTLDGDWMPYRCLPSENGPYGLLAEATTDWQFASYPEEALVPVIAMYDSLRGIQIMAADEHARQLSRGYRLGWQVDQNYSAGSQLRLACFPKDLLTGSQQSALLEPGKPLRDSIFVEPYRIAAKSQDPQQIEAQTTEVLRRMRDAMYACHLRSSPPRQFADGSVLPASRWLELKTEKTEDDFLRVASGIWDANLSLDGAPDSAVPIARERLISLVEPQDWLTPLPAKVDAGAAASYLSAIEAELSADGNDGVLLLPAQEENYSTASATLEMKSAELMRTLKPELLIVSETLPRLALPAYADCQISRVGANGSGGFDFSQRMKNIMLHELFWLRPRLVQDKDHASLSALLLASTLSVSGHEILPELREFQGFDAFALNQEGLRKSSGDLLILHTDPPASSYGAMDEYPPLAAEVVAALPADWRGASHIWIAFEGCSGSVQSDFANNITVSWPDGQWQGRLPPGIWKIEHPAPDNVQPGDVVLLRQSYISPAGPDVS